MTTTKEKLTQDQIYHLAEILVDNHVFSNQTMLVHNLLEETIGYDEITNFDYENQPNGYWLVSDWLLDRLIEKKETYLISDLVYESWWGRKTCGQAIYLDKVIQDIAIEHYTKHPYLYEKESK